MMARYFGTNGVRGKLDELTPELAMKVAQAVGMYFRKGKVLVAKDHRLTGELLKDAVMAGLQGVGCDVVDLGMATAPTAEFMLRELKGDGLVIVTASHNPPEWNALKVVDGKGITVSRERGEEIEKLMEKVKLAEWGKVGGKSVQQGADRQHINRIKELVDKGKIAGRKPFLVLDLANGTPALVAPQLFKEMECKVLTLNSAIDGHFPGRPSEPTEKNVQGLIRLVKENGADAGIAWDGDGDRVVFVDEKGNYVVGDKVFALSVLHKLKKEKGDIVTTVATSRAAEDIAGENGCKTVYTKVGAPYLSEEMAKGKAVLGGEEVGGVIWPEISLAKDGFITAAKIVEMVCEKPLSEWVAGLPQYSNVKIKVECKGDDKYKAIKEVKEFAEKEKLDFIGVDGVRVNFEDSWVIVRPSGTEHYVRVFAESRDKEKAEALVKEYEKLVKEAC